MQTITIEVRVSWDTQGAAEKEKMLLELAQEKAQEILATANLMGPRKEAEASIQCGDFFSVTKEVDVYGRADQTA